MTNAKGDFDITISFRGSKSLQNDIKKILRKTADRFYNESHFIRVAVLKLVKAEKEKLDNNKRIFHN